MQLPFKDTFEEFLGIVRDLWSTGNRWARVPILFFGLWPFVLLVYALGGAWSVGVIITLAAAALVAVQMTSRWFRLVAGLAVLAWLASGLALTFELAIIVAGVACVPLCIWGIGKPGNWFRQMTAWISALLILGFTIIWAVRVSVPLWMPPMVLMALVPAMVFVALLATNAMFAGALFGTSAAGRKAFTAFLPVVGAELAFGFCCWLIRGSETVREPSDLLAPALLIALTGVAFGFGPQGAWRKLMVGTSTMAFLILIGTAVWMKLDGTAWGNRMEGLYERLISKAPARSSSQAIRTTPAPAPDFLYLSLDNAPLRTFSVPLNPKTPTKWIRFDEGAEKCRIDVDPEGFGFTVVPLTGSPVEVPPHAMDFSFGKILAKPFRLLGHAPGQVATIVLSR